jgi:hypothetical protein
LERHLFENTYVGRLSTFQPIEVRRVSGERRNLHGGGNERGYASRGIDFTKEPGVRIDGVHPVDTVIVPDNEIKGAAGVAAVALGQDRRCATIERRGPQNVDCMRAVAARRGE